MVHLQAAGRELLPPWHPEGRPPAAPGAAVRLQPPAREVPQIRQLPGRTGRGQLIAFRSQPCCIAYGRLLLGLGTTFESSVLQIIN
jgi:hypothetical protein